MHILQPSFGMMTAQQRNETKHIGAGFAEAEASADYILKKLDENLHIYKRTFPGIHTEKLRYPHGGNYLWGHGFWTGMSWLAYELTGDEKYRSAADEQLDTYEKRFELSWNGGKVNEVHDLGLLYVPSCVAAYKLTGNSYARQLALRAAEMLSKRTTPSGMIYQHKRSRQRDYVSVAETLMDLPLLHWAYEETGNKLYREVTLRHVERALQWHLREDGSIFARINLDWDTGKLLNQITGFSPTSCWSRGLAYSIYGFALHYGYTSDPGSLDAAVRMADYFCGRLPKDKVCCWDLFYTGDFDQRDSSAAAIVASGLLELARHLEGDSERKARFEQEAVDILSSLAKHYLSADMVDCNGVLLHAVYNLATWSGVDECCLWGDYFFFEAVTKCLKRWHYYW